MLNFFFVRFVKGFGIALAVIVEHGLAHLPVVVLLRSEDERGCHFHVAYTCAHHIHSGRGVVLRDCGDVGRCGKVGSKLPVEQMVYVGRHRIADRERGHQRIGSLHQRIVNRGWRRWWCLE